MKQFSKGPRIRGPAKLPVSIRAVFAGQLEESDLSEELDLDNQAIVN